MTVSPKTPINASPTTLESAQALHARGFAVIPLPPRSKNPNRTGWQNERWSAGDLPGKFPPTANLGVLCGEPSAWLVDVDLDCAAARQLADIFLPQTDCIFGRSGSPRSHRLYVAEGAVTLQLKHPVRDAENKQTTLVELRSTGAQSVAPGSVHPSGEAIGWDQDGEPAVAEAAALRRRVELLAAAALLAMDYPGEGARHDFRRALAGALFSSGMREDAARQFVYAISEVGGANDPADASSCVSDTYRRAQAGLETTGWPTVATLVDARGAAKARSWIESAVGPAFRLQGAFTASPNGKHDAPPADDARPAIDAGNNDLEVTSGLAWQALQQSNDPPRLFRFGETPVRVGLAENETNPTPQTLTEDRLSHELARSVDWFRVGPKGDVKPASPPTRVIKDMIAAPTYPLPSLLSIVQTPTFAPNGALQVRPGYHEEGKTFYAPAPGFYVPDVPDVPTEDDVTAALSLILDDLLGDFPFVSASERANAVALFLDPYVRDMINGPTPLRMIESPTPGSGKGLLTEAILRTAIGDHFELTPAPRDDDEWRKQIATKLVKAPLAIVIDNLTAALDSGALATALTMTRWSSRRLGVNEDISVPARALWIVTANNPTMSTELARRTVRIRLDPKVDRPWQRTGFRHEDLRGWVDAQRPRLVHAALTLVQSWIVAGQPRGTQRLGSFEEWSTLQSGLLAHIGVDGFLANLEAFYESADLETTVWRHFVGSWFEKFGEAEVGVSDLFEIAMDTEGIDLGKGSDRAQRITFGRQLGKQRDRVIGDCRIVQSGVVKRVKRWRLVKSRPGGNPFDAFHETDSDNVAGNDKWTR